MLYNAYNYHTTIKSRSLNLISRLLISSKDIHVCMPYAL